MFFGEFRHNLDAKGRLSIPAKMRNQCTNTVYVTRGNDGCLNVYNEEGWQKYYESLSKLPQTKKDARAFLRLVTSRVSECEFDKMGRINIPAVLRNHSHIEKTCVVVGVGDHMEIWDETAWDQYYAAQDESFDGLSELLGEGE